MRQSAIKLEDVPREVIKHAEEQVAAALLAGQHDIIMFGYIYTGPNSEPPKDPTQTERVVATCTACGRPIWSTVLKETVLAVGSLANVKILCTETDVLKGLPLNQITGCLSKFIQLNQPAPQQVKNVMMDNESTGTS